MAADAAVMTTVVCGSSSFSAAAEAGEITTVDAVVETAVDVIPADAESFKGQTYPEQGTSVYLTPPVLCPKVPALETHDFRCPFIY